MELSGRVAIVTGAGKRIGRSIALTLADHGCDVLVHYGNSRTEAEQTAAEVRNRGVRAVTVSADLSDPALARTTIFEACGAELGQASVLVNCAAIFGEGHVDDTSSEDWGNHLSVNLTAPFELLQGFANQVGKDVVGQVVNIVDWRAHEHPAGHLAYTVSKSGLLALTRVAAQDLAPLIRVNAIAPGPILPPPGKDKEAIQPVIDKLPLKRMGDPADIANAVVWLAQSDFVTGTLIHVDGGQQFTGGL